jgi:hypothetical protein
MQQGMIRDKGPFVIGPPESPYSGKGELRGSSRYMDTVDAVLTRGLHNLSPQADGVFEVRDGADGSVRVRCRTRQG